MRNVSVVKAGSTSQLIKWCAGTRFDPDEQSVDRVITQQIPMNIRPDAIIRIVEAVRIG